MAAAAGADREAQSKIETSWQEVAADYTVGWASLGLAAELVPDFAARLEAIAHRAVELPVIVYTARERRADGVPGQLIMAVPYDPDCKTRLLSAERLGAGEQELLSKFAQSIWYLIGRDVLPHPETAGRQFHTKLVGMTGEKLVEL